MKAVALHEILDLNQQNKVINELALRWQEVDGRMISNEEQYVDRTRKIEFNGVRDISLKMC